MAHVTDELQRCVAEEFGFSDPAVGVEIIRGAEVSKPHTEGAVNALAWKRKAPIFVLRSSPPYLPLCFRLLLSCSLLSPFTTFNPNFSALCCFRGVSHLPFFSLLSSHSALCMPRFTRTTSLTCPLLTLLLLFQ